ncbi:MAG: Gfo/Idh/MocA family oxidoreductase, partial [Armatimonadetes bacterium]|nr:Gfo/Idh/MocA family oxidoreductase [Armatimonadota bacterium]
DLQEERARSYAECFGAQYAADYREMIGDPEVDAIWVLTVSAAHREMCLAAIEAGQAVVCEKTLATNAQDALEIVQAAGAKGVVFYTSYMKRFIPAVQKAKALLPTLGRITSTYIRSFQPAGDLWGAMPETGGFHTPPGGASGIVANYGGGALTCCGSHILDLTCWFLGRPRGVYGRVYVPEGRDYDLQANALLETANGPVHYETIWHPLGRIGLLRDGWDERMEINGLQGRLDIHTTWWSEVDTKASVCLHYDNATGAATEYRYPPLSPFDRAVAFYCEQIARGEQGEQSRLTGYDVDELIETITRSAELGQAIEVPWRA